MSELLRFFKDMRDNGYGLAEIAAQLGTSAIAEPVAGFAAMYDPVHGADAIREGMTYQPRSQAAQEYSQSIGNAAKTAVKPVMPIIDTWKKGVDIAGQYSPVVGAGLRTVPTAIGIAMGAKPALQAGRQVSEGLGAMQGRMIANANAPRTLNTGFRGQRGVFAGINALTADKEALAKAKAMIARGDFPDDVWQETGWGQGADGKWRFEIDDSKAALRDYQFTPKEAYEQARTNAFIDDNELIKNRAKSMSEYALMTKNQLRDEYKKTGNEIVDAAINGDIEKAKLLSEKRSGLDALLGQMSSREYGKASSFIAHGDLGQAYPDVYKIHTRVSPADVGAANAHYYRGNDLQSEQIVLGRKPILNSDKSTMLHEFQHAIQNREGFASGGSPSQFKGIYNDPYKAYRKLAGEVEARMVQNRMDLTPEQRREIYPFAIGRYGYDDIPKNEQIIAFGNNKANAQRPLTEFEQAHLAAQRNAALPVNQRGLGLPADNTAMDRARAMGFDVDNPVYTGISPREGYGKSELWSKLERKTDPNMTGFDRSVFSSTSPKVASGYTGVVNLSPDIQHRIAFDGLTEAKKLQNAEGFQPTFIGEKMLDDLGDDFTFNDVKNYLSDNDISPDDIMEFSKVIDTDKYHDVGSSIIPMYANKKDYLNLDAGGSNWDEVIRAGSYDEDNLLDSLVKQINEKTGKNISRDDVLSERGIEYDGQMDRNITTDDLKEIAKDYGLSGVEIKNVIDSAGNTRLKANTIATTKGHTLRALSAAFDPFNRDSSNLLAQSAKLAPTTALGAYMYNEKRKKSQGKQ